MKTSSGAKRTTESRPGFWFKARCSWCGAKGKVWFYFDDIAAATSKWLWSMAMIEVHHLELAAERCPHQAPGAIRPITPAERRSADEPLILDTSHSKGILTAVQFGSWWASHDPLGRTKTALPHGRGLTDHWWRGL